jgi:hypothetical protein
MGGPPAMSTVQATVPALSPPAWAILQRRLFDVLNASIEPFASKYTRPDGELIWRETFAGRDGLDDAYESFYNWPLLYLLGGDDGLLARSLHHWNAVTRQFARYGHVYREFERGYDWFHQGESLLAFYFLCLAAPDLPANRDRARRFAGFYLDEDDEARNYDPRLKLVRAPHNGSAGPRPGIMDGEPCYAWSAAMRPYGLPFHDLPGITSYDDLKDPARARQMGQAMAERMGLGDVPANLAITSLVANAYCLTGEEKYRAWVAEYTEAWMERARQNGGLLPDNVGLSGQIGEYIDGKWYGGLYGWTWPHGFYNIGMAAVIAGCNATLLTGDDRYLDLPREQIDRLLELGQMRDGVLCLPHRYGDGGWFDYRPLDLWLPTAIWNLSQAPDDLARLEFVRVGGSEDWNEVRWFRNKHDDGHEAPWLRFLAGDNEGYPERIMRAMLGQVARRLEQIRTDTADLTQVNLHHWQQLNPVTTEGLIQLTLGGPPPIYNGGLLLTSLRYFDAERRRPGLPPDVAALVERLERERVVVHLVNTSPLEERTLIVQAGALGEHRFKEVRYAVRLSDYPGPIGSYGIEPLRMEERRQPINSRHLSVHLPPGTRITLDLHLKRLAQPPTYALPWGD